MPYPTPGSIMTGSSGYCERVAANGASIDGSYLIDTSKLTNLIDLGARWSRMPVWQFDVDFSHIFGPANYAFGSIDAAQCISYVYHGIPPVIGLEAGPVMYDSTPGTFSPVSVPTYKTAADFGQYCGAVAAHERAVFPGITKFSLPGNEVNSNPQLFPGGVPQIALYSEACYSAIKAANPNAFVYAFELNMDGSLNAPGFVRQLVALGCGPHTCYDGISIHLSLRYPIPPPGTPCFPNPGGDYSMQCVTDIENAAGAPIHVLISESEYLVPAYRPRRSDEGASRGCGVQRVRAKCDDRRRGLRQRRRVRALPERVFHGRLSRRYVGQPAAGVRRTAVAREHEPALGLVSRFDDRVEHRAFGAT